MTPEKERALLDAGIKPAIIQRSSDKNKQAIIVIERDPRYIDEQKLANQLVVRLNKAFGDEKFTGVVHPFRLAGFSNKKAGKDNYLTKINLAIDRQCELTAAAMKRLRQDNLDKKQHVDSLSNTPTTKSPKPLTDRTSDYPLSTMATVEQAYRREVNKIVGLVKKKGWTLDWSRVDFDATKTLLIAGCHAELIEHAIKVASPDISKRHRDVARYASDTVNNASADKAVVNALRDRAERDESGPTPGL